jgi:hypothetical protein
MEVKTINILIGALLLLPLFLLFLSGIHVVNSIRIKSYFSRTLFTPLPEAQRLDSFTIANPYQGPGEYRKAQLHLHTSNSKDVACKIPVRDTIRRYKEAGYNFVVITDHDQITTCSELNSSDFVCLPGIEITIPFIFWPLGKHLVVINAPDSSPEKVTYRKLLRRKSPDSLMVPAHPNWLGNLGTGFWYAADIHKAGFQLLEIHNHHSDSSYDRRLWHKLLAMSGHDRPVWGVAVDDTDNAEPLDRGWIMVKAGDINADSFITALKNGKFYSTTGPNAEFQVKDGAIEVQTTTPSQINFLDGRNQLVATFLSTTGIFRPQGHEGFIRIEIQNASGRTAWSQPFFLIPS